MQVTGTILLGWDPGALGQEQREWIEIRAPQARVLITEDQGEIESAVASVEIATGRIPRELLATAPRLRWFQQFGAGVDWLLRYPEIRSKEFILTNGSGIHAKPISEHVLGMMLTFAHRLHDSVRLQMRHEWAPWRGKGMFELWGKTMVLVGVGAIGQRIAELARAFGMRVIGVRRNPERIVAGIERMVGPDHLREALPEADFLVLTVPLTPETRKMIGAQELALLRSSAYVINIGRGGTIDEAALIKALRAETIAGAGLDVFEQEPLPAESPLWDLETVIITSHYSGSTPARSQRAWALFSDNLERFLTDRPLRNVVDKKRGY